MNWPPYHEQQPPSPGQFAPPTPSLPPSPSQRYSDRLLVLLTLAYAAFWVLVFVGGVYAPGRVAAFFGNLGISLFWGLLTSVLVMDCRGALSVQGLISWQRIRGTKRILLGLLRFLVSPFLLGIYLVRTLLLYRRS